MQTEERFDFKRAVDEHWPLAIVGALSGILIVVMVRYIDHGTMGFFAEDQSWGDTATSFPVRLLGVLGACLLMLGLIQLSLFVWWRRRIEQIPRRAVGFALLLLASSGLLGLIGGADATWGGTLGRDLARGFEGLMPTPMALLVAGGLVVFALVLSRDWFFFEAWRRWIGDSQSEAFALGMGPDSATETSGPSAVSTPEPRELRRQATDRLGTSSVLDNRDIVQSDSFPDLEPIVADLDDIVAPRPLQVDTAEIEAPEGERGNRRRGACASRRDDLLRAADGRSRGPRSDGVSGRSGSHHGHRRRGDGCRRRTLVLPGRRQPRLR